VTVRASEIREAVAAVLVELRPAHLVHVGAHDGEEVAHYRAAGVDRITLVEPIPELAARLRQRHPDATVVEAACSDVDGTAVLRIPARTNMATLVDGLEGREVRVATRRLDGIAPDADVAVIDVQGHEYAVLSAAPWESLRAVVVETCTVEDPTLSPTYESMVEYMAGRGFVEVAHFPRDYDWIQRWAFGRKTETGAEVRDVIFIREDTHPWS